MLTSDFLTFLVLRRIYTVDEPGVARRKSLFHYCGQELPCRAVHGAELPDAIKQRITPGDSWLVLSEDWPFVPISREGQKHVFPPLRTPWK